MIRSYQTLTERILKAGQAIQNLEIHPLGDIETGPHLYPFWMFTTPAGFGKKKVCLSAGIHGDEPAGIEAIIAFMEGLKQNTPFLEKYQFTLFPCINPFGYEFDLRENGEKADLNRQFNQTSPSREVYLLKQGIEGESFDLFYEFHEDKDSKGFYLYELSTEGSALGNKIIERVRERCPINDDRKIEEMPSQGGVIYTSFETLGFWERITQIGGWPQAIFFAKRGTPVCITAETPIHIEMPTRVNTHLTAFETALSLI